MAAISGLDMSMLTYAARLATFNTEHQLTKRRASSQKKKQASIVSWPHESPSGEELARAGFFFKPAPDSDDNAQCFHCAVKLDGWESQDVPLQEHLAHSAHCSYALSLSVSDKAEERDPMSPELVDARTSTFGDMWPHEHKKGWKPKVKQMVEAGWAYDPSPADEDGATCFYCNMSLDGWEPKDSPLEEHRRREPNCLFFALMDRYKSSRRKGGRGRASTASKASRLSTQSVQSTFSEAPSLMSLGDAGPNLDVEDSIAVDTTITSDAGKGRKKTTKGKKKTSRQASAEPSISYPALQDASTAQDEDNIYAVPVDDDPMPIEEPPKPKRGRKPKNTQDSTIIDDSVAEPAAKPTRGRKKIREPTPPVETSLDESQLQSELQEAAEEAATPQSPPARSGRGFKRTSDGVEKHSVIEDATIDEAATKPKKAAKASNAKKGKKATKDTEEVDDSVAITQPEDKPKRTRSKKTKKIEPEPEPEPEVELELEEIVEPEVEAQPEPLHAAEPLQEAEPEREAFERNFEIADSDAGVDNGTQEEVQEESEEQYIDQENIGADVEADVDMNQENGQGENALDAEFDNLENVEVGEDMTEDVVDNEIEVEEEEEQVVSTATTPAAEEFEPSPTPEAKRHSAASLSSVRRSVVQYPHPEEAAQSEHSTPRSARSPQQSDDENQPPSSSTHAPPTAQKIDIAAPALGASNSAIQPREIFASPTKTTRVPLAASTPNRSPTRRSPSKFGRLTSSTPWEPVDLESVFFPDSENENGDADDVFKKLLEVGGALTSPEKKMTVEEWIRSRAELGESKLKNECERMVMLFEKEGNRGLAALNGIQTSS
ncbi:hypothetical protein D6D25_04709 [Aureobasidium pullulans]|nr:hypothetical protein D6D25_04709 [Aureobasidium pullulans]